MPVTPKKNNSNSNGAGGASGSGSGSRPSSSTKAGTPAAAAATTGAPSSSSSSSHAPASSSSNAAAGRRRVHDRQGVGADGNANADADAEADADGEDEVMQVDSAGPTNGNDGNVVEIDDGDEDEDEEEEGDEEEYEVEKIVDHGYTKSDGQFCFLIKWVGYPEEDNTWEPEANIDAKELIDAYWDKLPGNRQKDKRAKLAAKLKRDKQGRIEPLSQEEVKQREEKRKRFAEEAAGAAADSKPSSSTTTSTFPPKNAKSLRGGGLGPTPPSADEVDSATFLKIQESLQEHYTSQPNWEPLVEEITTVERPSATSPLQVYLTFKRPRASLIFPASVVYQRCPQAMLKFYEAKVRFTKPPKQ